MKLKRDYVLLEPTDTVEEERTIIITPTEISNYYKVVDVGPGTYYGDKFVEASVRPGSVVMLGDCYKQEITVKGKKFVLVREPDIVLEL